MFLIRHWFPGRLSFSLNNTWLLVGYRMRKNVFVCLERSPIESSPEVKYYHQYNQLSLLLRQFLNTWTQSAWWHRVLDSDTESSFVRTHLWQYAAGGWWLAILGIHYTSTLHYWMTSSRNLGESRSVVRTLSHGLRKPGTIAPTFDRWWGCTSSNPW